MFSTYSVPYNPTPQVSLNCHNDQRVTKNPAKQRRTRGVFSPEQLTVLEREFECHPYNTYQRREELSARLKINARQIKVWFQNRRMRLKKEGKMMSKRFSFQEVFEKQYFPLALPQTAQHPTTTTDIRPELHSAYPPTPPSTQESAESEVFCEEHKLLMKVLNKETAEASTKTELYELDEILELLNELTTPTPLPSETGEPTDMQDCLKESNTGTAIHDESTEFTNLLACMADMNQIACDMDYNPDDNDVIFRIEQDLLATDEEYNRRLPANASKSTFEPTMQPLPPESSYQVPCYHYQ